MEISMFMAILDQIKYNLICMPCQNEICGGKFGQLLALDPKWQQMVILDLKKSFTGLFLVSSFVSIQVLFVSDERNPYAKTKCDL